MRRSLGVSERRACRTLGQHRSTQRQVPRGRPDEDLFTEDIIELAKDHGRYEDRMITGLVNNAGWHENPKRVERIWRREGLKVPSKLPGKGRLWLNDGSCVRLRPEQPIHVWSYDFVQDRTHDGRVFRRLIIIDEFTREALMIRDDRKLNSVDVVDALTDLFILRGPPAFVRSDNGPEFVAEKVTTWISAVGAKMAFIKSGSPSENGYCESFNTRFRNELLKREIFWHPVGSAVQLLLLTGQRRDEVSHMRWTDLDLDAGIRTIPAERNKSGRLHVVPLSPLVVTILQSLP